MIGYLRGRVVRATGEQVVIETIFISGNAASNNNVLDLLLRITTSGVVNEYDLTPIFDSTASQPGGSSFTGVQSFRLYADPGSVIECDASTPNANPVSGLNFECVISGYFVTLP